MRRLKEGNLVNCIWVNCCLLNQNALESKAFLILRAFKQLSPQIDSIYTVDAPFGWLNVGIRSPAFTDIHLALLAYFVLKFDPKLFRSKLQIPVRKANRWLGTERTQYGLLPWTTCRFFDWKGWTIRSFKDIPSGNQRIIEHNRSSMINTHFSMNSHLVFT